MDEMNETRGKQTRVTLTQSHLASHAGKELLTICESITADGELTKEEIVNLYRWLKANDTAHIPAISFLRGVLDVIVADRQVTIEERKTLYKAIERILPADVREKAVAKRWAIEQRIKEDMRQQREAAKELKRLEQERERVIDSFDFMVAGARHEDRPATITRYIGVGSRVFLNRDSQNPYSPNAVEVRSREGYLIGYVPEADDEAKEVYQLLAQGYKHRALVTKLLDYDPARPIPVVQAFIYPVESTNCDAVSESSVPAKTNPPVTREAAPTALAGSHGCGCSLTAVAIVILLVSAISLWVR